MSTASETPQATDLAVEHVSLDDFFNASSARMDRWNQLSNCAAKLSHASHDQAHRHKLEEQARHLLEELEPLETYWAFPGKTGFSAIKGFAGQADCASLARSVARTTRALMSGSYRRKAAAWNLTDDIEEELGAPDYSYDTEQSRPYFEVLVVAANLTAEEEQQARDELRKLRRAEDPFIYETVFVPSFEDAIVGTLFNYNVQAVLIYEGFPFQSHYELPILTRYLEQYVEADSDTLAPEAYGASLAEQIREIRPELDIYIMSDRSVEDLASNLPPNVRRVFYDVEELLELHLSILEGVDERYDTPFFSNLKHYARKPVGTFHALPVARGKSIFKSNWIQDMGHFYGANLFLAESSATTGGLDSLLEPTGNIRLAQEKAARAFGAEHTYFVTNGTSTSNKIVVQGLIRPGDIVLVDRNCHKSHHYGMVLSGGQPLYLDAFPLEAYSMYGGVPLKTIKKTLLDLKAEGKLDQVRMLLLTNCTFDGHIYNVQRFMEECLAIKPDLVFLWDEAWYAFARFDPFYRERTAMGAVEALRKRYSSAEYRQEYEAFKALVGDIDPKDEKLLTTRLLPDPDKLRLRVYATQSTHKSLSSLRQGSMIHVNDEDFAVDSEESFEEAYMTHSSTSPNQQIIASLDLARRQAELEGYELLQRMVEMAMTLRKHVSDHPLISKYFRILTPAEMIPAEHRETGLSDYTDPDVGWKDILDAVENDEFILDPTRMTLMCGTAGFDGTEFKNLLADKYDIQLNKTSRNSILLQANINVTRSAISYLIEVLGKIARELDDQLSKARHGERADFEARVKSLVEDVPDLPNFSHFHDCYRTNPTSATREGHMREAFFIAYYAEDCEHVKLDSPDIDERLKNGPELVSANFVIPYPPGFPIMVPGQVISHEIIEFMRKLDVKEIHGYHPAVGLKLIKPDVLADQQEKAA